MYSAHRREYYQYRRMIQACFKPRYPLYRNIGAFGITVFPSWCEPHYGFRNFLNDIGPMPEAGCQLDRKFLDLDFTPSNTYWRVPEKQLELTQSYA